MISLKMQPAFNLDVPLGDDQLIKQIKTVLQSPDLDANAQAAGRCVEFKIEASQRRFWSPQLYVEVSPLGDTNSLGDDASPETSRSGDVQGAAELSQTSDSTAMGCRLFCRFAPRPEVWTMFMFAYFLASFCIVAAAIYGYVQWILGGSPWALWAIPFCLLAIGLIHVASIVGQNLSRDQMTLLRERLDRTLELAQTPRINPST